jgi:hypothetical protein
MMKPKIVCVLSILIALGCGSDGQTGSSAANDTSLDAAPDVTGDVAVDSTIIEDTHASDSGRADIAEAPDTIEPEEMDSIHIEDTTVLDTATDSNVVEETQEPPPPPAPPAVPAGVMFRIDWVNILEPAFCVQLAPNEPCTDVSSLINAFLSGHITDAVEPLDIVGLFKPFDFDPSADVSMMFGRGDCIQDGQGNIISCDFWDFPSFFEGTMLQGPGTCTAFVSDNACFTTTKADLKLDLDGLTLAFSEGFTSGQFNLDENSNATSIFYAYVQGFMPESTAAMTEVYVPGLGTKMLIDFLQPQDKIEKNGTPGWFFVVDYSGITVPYVPTP